MERKIGNEPERKYEKIESLKTFERIGLPIIPYKILDEKNFREEIAEFARKQSVDKIMVRTDGRGKDSPRLLDAPIDEETFKEIGNYFLNGYLVFVAHPGNIYRNLHSVNIRVADDESYMEAVGPGFIASDLNRGNMPPHETFSINPDDSSLQDRRIFANQYERDRNERINNSELEALRINRSYLLAYSSYKELNDYELSVLEDAVVKLRAWKRANKKNNFIASMSFIDLGTSDNPGLKPVFWDIHEEAPIVRTVENKFYRHEGD